MNIKNGTPLFIRLVRAVDLAAEVSSHIKPLRTTVGVCDIHHVTDFYIGVHENLIENAVCCACVAQSRALSAIGKHGGRVGGRVMTDAKREQRSREQNDRTKSRNN